MSKISVEIREMVEMLPEEEQQLAYEFIKRMVIAVGKGEFLEGDTNGTAEIE